MTNGPFPGRTLSEGPRHRQHYWDRFVRSAEPAHPDDGAPSADPLPPGEALAALRRGADRDPGAVPEMWRYYTELEPGGRITVRLRAEHHVLALFGFHQQSSRSPVNVPGLGVGKALGLLRSSSRFSTDALDRRFTTAATTEDVDRLATLLRGLIRQLRRESIGLDYDGLFHDLVGWQRGRADRVRLRWASDYFIPPRKDQDRDPATAGTTDIPNTPKAAS